MSNDPAGSARGGHGRLLNETVHEVHLGHPLNLRDLAACQGAARKIEATMRARAIALRSSESIRSSARLFRMLRSLSADLSRNQNATLTDRQRAICARVLGLEELPAPATNPVLADLPKKPPRRIPKSEDDPR